MRITVEVRPGSSTENIQAGSGSPDLKVKVKAPARNGQANRALLSLLARYYGVPKSSVRLLSGHRSRRKTLDVRTGI